MSATFHFIVFCQFTAAVTQDDTGQTVSVPAVSRCLQLEHVNTLILFPRVHYAHSTLNQIKTSLLHFPSDSVWC